MVKTISTRTLLIISFLLNAGLITLLVGILFYRVLDGCAETANGRLGKLKEDLDIGHIEGGKKFFRLPKGLIVRDASASGMGWFEPHRFRIVITSEREGLVDFSIDERTLRETSELYSADKH